MKTTAQLKEIEAVVGCGYDFINNMVRHTLFNTPLVDPAPGKPRQFSRANALEIAFRFHALRAGMRSDMVSAAVKKWLTDAAEGTGGRFVAVNATTGDHQDYGSERAGYIDLGMMLSDDIEGGYAGGERRGSFTMPIQISIINRQEIVDRIQRLFTEHEGDGE